MTNTRKAPERQPQMLSRTSRLASSLGAALGFVLVPKCPLCVAAYLMSLGVSASAASLAAPLVRPFALGLAITATAALLYAGWRAVRRRAVQRRATCCN